MKTLTFLTALTFALAAPAFASDPLPPCPTHPAVKSDSWTNLVDALPSPERLIEGSYRGEGGTTETDYNLHLLHYMDVKDQFVAVMHNEKKNIGSIGMLKQQIPGTYLWYGIKVVGTEAQQLLPVFDKAPLFRFTLTSDSAGRAFTIEATSNKKGSDREMITFTKARAPLMHDAPVRGEYASWHAGDTTWTATINPLESSAEIPAPTCTPDPADKKEEAPTPPAWSIRKTEIADNGAASSADYFARLELPGVLALREARFEDYVVKPSNTISWVMVSVFRPGPGLDRDRENALFFATDANGFLRQRAYQVRATN